MASWRSTLSMFLEREERKVEQRMKVHVGRWGSCRKQLQGGKWVFCHCMYPAVATLSGQSFRREDHSPDSRLPSSTPELWFQREERPALSQPRACGLPRPLRTRAPVCGADR